MKSIIIAFTAGLLVAMIMADPLMLGSRIIGDNQTVDTYTAVGTCPPRDTNITVYLTDSANCSIYYICSNGRPIAVVCPPEMSFNTKLNICDWSIDVDCNLGGNLTSLAMYEDILPQTAVGTCPPRDTNITIYLTDSANCSVYYICSNGRPIEVVCPPEMSFNSKLNICDWSIDVDCNLNGSFLSTELMGLDANPLSAVGTCPPRDTNVTVFLPDSANCTIYYICSNGRPYAAACGPEMAWNAKINACDWAVDVDCKSSLLDAKPLTAVGTCPEKDPSMPVFLPDSEDCQLYYECSGGVPIQNNCPGDLEFNVVLKVCDDPLDANCKASGNSSSTSSSSSSTTSSTPAPTTVLF